MPVLWKALADPKRRRIIELLEERARTTGEICAYFDVSRFAIMRHLKVLEQAGLVQIRREGRQRWNILNGALLQDGALLKEIQHSYPNSFPNGGGVATAVAPQLPRFKQRLILPAPPDLVFLALTDEIDSWWSYRITADSHVYLEAQVGGRFFEAFSGGGAALYGLVTFFKPNQEIRLEGSLGMADVGINHAIHIKLEPDSGRTTCLQLTHHFSGQVSAVTMAAFERSWEELLAQRLHGFVKRRFQTQPPS